jgi:hypothetical protein
VYGEPTASASGAPLPGVPGKGPTGAGRRDAAASPIHGNKAKEEIAVAGGASTLLSGPQTFRRVVDVDTGM